jgi:conjugal transfer pilus assembly protein TraA
MKQSRFLKLAVVATVATIATTAALAGSDTTFSTTATKVKDWMEGSLGRLFALGSLAVGLGVGIVKQSVMAVVVGAGMGLAASTAPGVVNTLLSAAM